MTWNSPIDPKALADAVGVCFTKVHRTQMRTARLTAAWQRSMLLAIECALTGERDAAAQAITTGCNFEYELTGDCDQTARLGVVLGIPDTADA